MTHSLTLIPVAAISPPPPPLPPPSRRNISILRRDVLVGTVLGMSIMGDIKSADAAARRPPPPPPTEKKDPNVSGVLAKVLASKKRKEAMKESMAQLRNKGKPITSPAATE